MGNESNADVYFDDVTVTHGQDLQVQENQYDPTGLELAGLTRDTPGLKPLNQYRWNGKEFQTDLGLNWTQLDWRMFDAQLNRLPGVDPEIETGQESMSPYAFGFDNAVRNNDPNGRCPGGICPPNPLQRTGNAASQPDLITALQEPISKLIDGITNRTVSAFRKIYSGLEAADRIIQKTKGSGDHRKFGQMIVSEKGNGVCEPSLADKVKVLAGETVKGVLELMEILGAIEPVKKPSVKDLTGAVQNVADAEVEKSDRNNSKTKADTTFREAGYVHRAHYKIKQDGVTRDVFSDQELVKERK